MLLYVYMVNHIFKYDIYDLLFFQGLVRLNSNARVLYIDCIA
jgi:hypothetical protein